MPFYEFACLDCGKEFSAVLSLREHDRKSVACPRCKSKRVEQLVTVRPGNPPARKRCSLTVARS